MMRSARQIAVLANQEKLGTTDYFKVTGFSNVDFLITDLASDARQLDEYRPFNLEIL
jgi:DeoR/GlpR family transcriptional regulator of sugar metabolism